MGNLSAIERVVRAVFGVVVVSYSLPRGLDNDAWHWIGIAGAFLLLTAAVRFCPLSQLLGRSRSLSRP
ncbi:DUF2892 domain-containing protein [Bradyrhizobium sp. LHD-71]|uniref:YgaP family membrane protein n=1 Tax=Bradyrhizobium sp. LHD-71 TaxID=3072141 RepID=UPI00280FB5E0|nr:DUF2892 domain-containing protein [Bradyrhizobium sp. LHD-71]MDQ8726333.1 DUF2892 domain-containing protein [Bradyrhizobium sp. LHD-71]